jgi:mannose-6-phosphate isomerase-like protein (cupin superfamily)
MKPRTEERPWGSFREFIKNEPATVKIITVKAGEALSLQVHKQRREFWKILSGNPTVTIGSEVSAANPGDEFFVEPEIAHRISAAATDATILEISLGNFEETDITRLEDNYGRS